MRFPSIQVLATGLALSLSGLGQAIDTDIYVSGNSGTTEPPNILFMFDNSANWNANSSSRPKRDIEHEALFRFVDAIEERLNDPTNTKPIDHNIALMGGTDANNPGGGKPLYFFAPIRKNDVSASMARIREIKGLLYCSSDLGSSLYSACIRALTDPDGDKLIPETDAFVDADLTAAGVLETLVGEEFASWTEFNSWIVNDSGAASSIYEGKLPSSNRAKYATQLLEGYHWFQGNDYRAGKLDGASTYDVNAFLPGDQSEYRSPIIYDPADDEPLVARDPSAEYCGRNHIVYMGNGGPSSGEDSEAEIELLNIGGSNNIINILKDDSYESNWADEVARFMYRGDVNDVITGDQNVQTNVIDVFDPTTEKNTKPNRSAHALLQSMAISGGGEYLQASDADEIVSALLDLLDNILAINDVFAASALPVSVNVRGTNLNQVYIGVFRPDGEGRPRWNGNMKMYQLGFDQNTGRVFLADADGNEAASSATGFIGKGARSFWTHDSSFWTYTDGTVGDGEGGASDNPDGDLVEKGAVAQQLRERLEDGVARTLYTCRNCTAGGTLDAFDKTIPETELGLESPSAANRDGIIDWASGYNTSNSTLAGYTDADTLISSTARPSIHGDVLHSRPAVINYGDTDGDPNTPEDVYVFYGSNDGWLRAVKGGTDESTLSTSGDELWAFVAPEHWAEFDTLRDNDIMASQDEKPFFVDGVIGSYVETSNGVATKAHLYLTMRRGGDFIYALDVTDPKTPKFMWRIGATKADGVTVDPDYADLGQTWSAPSIGKIKMDTGVDSDGDGVSDVVDKVVLIFGLGYDPEANDGYVGRAQTPDEGAGIVMVDALNGELIWKAGPTGMNSTTFLNVPDMKYAVPADLNVIDRDRNGYIDRIYFGDTGGQLWRVDVFNKDRTQWRAKKLLELPTGQKFLSAPDAAASTDPLQGFDAVVIASGDRENPFNTSINNYIVVYKDWDQGVVTSTATPKTLTELFDATATTDFTTEPTKAVNGYYIQLMGDGEKGISKPAIVNSIVFLNTYEPALTTAVCNSLGTARSYQFDFMTSRATYDYDADGDVELDDRFTVVEGGGLIPDPVPVIVDINGKLVEAIISGTQVEQFPNTVLERRQQTFWYKQIDD